MVALFNLGYLAQCKLFTAFYVHTNSFHNIFPRVELSAIDLHNTGCVHVNSAVGFFFHTCLQLYVQKSIVCKLTTSGIDLVPGKWS